MEESGTVGSSVDFMRRVAEQGIKQKALSGETQGGEKSVRDVKVAHVYPCPEWAPIMIEMIGMEMDKERRIDGASFHR